MRDAILGRNKYTWAFRAFQAVMTESMIAEWATATELWETTGNKDMNPFKRKIKREFNRSHLTSITDQKDIDATQQQVRLALAQQVAAEEASVHDSGDVHPSEMIALGIQLEEQQ